VPRLISGNSLAGNLSDLWGPREIADFVGYGGAVLYLEGELKI